MGDQPMDLQLSGFAPEQFVMVQTVSPPVGENCTQRDELPNICYTGSVTAISNRDGIKEQNHVEADPSADREIRTWRRRNSQRA
jgi:hypothetical protein